MAQFLRKSNGTSHEKIVPNKKSALINALSGSLKVLTIISAFRSYAGGTGAVPTTA